MYTERDLKDAEKFRSIIHKEALEKVRALYPQAEDVVDCYCVEDYLTQRWDYPGQWYTMVSIPEGFDSRDDLVDKLFSDTIRSLRIKL